MKRFFFIFLRWVAYWQRYQSIEKVMKNNGEARKEEGEGMESQEVGGKEEKTNGNMEGG